MLGRPFWGRYAHGIIDWLTINVVLYLAFTAQVRFVHRQQVGPATADKQFLIPPTATELLTRTAQHSLPITDISPLCCELTALSPLLECLDPHAHMPTCRFCTP